MKFFLYWNDGTVTSIEGDTLDSAYANAGISPETLKDLHHWSELSPEQSGSTAGQDNKHDTHGPHTVPRSSGPHRPRIWTTPSRNVHAADVHRTGAFRDFLSFQTMITPAVIMVAYYALSVLGLVAAIMTTAQSSKTIEIDGEPFTYSPDYVPAYSRIIWFTFFLWGRVFVETLLVPFKIHENVLECRRALED